MYFGEQIKKYFDDKISQKEFSDADRPMKELVDVDKVRYNNRKWDKFKVEYETTLLRDMKKNRQDGLMGQVRDRPLNA